MTESKEERNKAYWSANVRLIIITLCIWATVSYGFGMLLRPWLRWRRHGLLVCPARLNLHIRSFDLFLCLENEQAR